MLNFITDFPVEYYLCFKLKYIKRSNSKPGGYLDKPVLIIEFRVLPHTKTSIARLKACLQPVDKNNPERYPVSIHRLHSCLTTGLFF
jgi:hypothetical protein